MILFYVIVGVGGASSAWATGNSAIAIKSGAGAGVNRPFASGQRITVDVVPNGTLSVANLKSAGYPGGAAVFKIIECADPGGLASALPTKSLSCDGDTVVTYSTPNPDGSFTYSGYPIYALPDKRSFYEPPDTLPVCGDTLEKACVLYVGTDVNDFAKPHVFSQPFLVSANGTDSGTPPGDGGISAASGTSVAEFVVITVAVVLLGGLAFLLVLRRRRPANAR